MSEDRDELARLRDWADVIDDSNYYEILGVLELADDAAIKKAFHEFALAFHPDAHVDAPEDVIDCVRYIFRRGAEAYRVLYDPELRARYDMAVHQGFLRLIERGEPRSERMPLSVKSLEDVCRTPAAKLCAKQATEYISAGDLVEARAKLKAAFLHDHCDNEELEQRIDALDMAMFAQGS